MRCCRRVLIVTSVFVVAWGESRTTTQSALEREVGRLVTGQPLIFMSLCNDSCLWIRAISEPRSTSAILLPTAAVNQTIKVSAPVTMAAAAQMRSRFTHAVRRRAKPSLLYTIQAIVAVVTRYPTP
jgi:hypothetical protein